MPTFATGTDGAFRIDDLSEGWHRLEIHADGYVRGWLRAASGDEGVRIALPRSATLSGIVLLPGGAPAAGADFWIVSDRDWFSADADALGRFEVRGLSAGHVSLRATMGELSASTDLQLLEGGGVSGVRLMLAPIERSCVRLRIVDADGHPIPGACTGSQCADDNGSVTLPFSEPAGTDLEITASAEHFLETSVALRTSAESEPTVHDVVLRRGISVTLDVRDPDGSPIDANATFHDREWNERRCLDPEAIYDVRIRAKGFLDLEIPRWHAQPALAATLRPAATVRGRLRDGSGIVEGWVAFRGSAGEAHMDTDEEGEFELGGLGEGSGVLVAGGEGGPGAAVTVATFPGTVTDVGTLVIVPQVRVTGRVLDAASRPLGGAVVTCETGLPGTPEEAFTHADGTFRISVPGFTGAWITARRPGLGTARSYVRAGAGGAVGDIVLSEAGAIELDEEEDDGTDDSTELAVLWPDGQTAGEGDRVSDLAPGPYVARLSRGTTTVEQEVEVRPRETTRVSLP